MQARFTTCRDDTMNRPAHAQLTYPISRIAHACAQPPLERALLASVSWKKPVFRHAFNPPTKGACHVSARRRESRKDR